MWVICKHRGVFLFLMPSIEPRALFTPGNLGVTSLALLFYRGRTLDFDIWQVYMCVYVCPGVKPQCILMDGYILLEIYRINRIVMWTTNANHICNLKFFRGWRAGSGVKPSYCSSSGPKFVPSIYVMITWSLGFNGQQSNGERPCLKGVVLGLKPSPLTPNSSAGDTVPNRRTWASKQKNCCWVNKPKKSFCLQE